MIFLENVYRLINKYNQKTKIARRYGTEDLLYSAEVHMIEIIGSYKTITTTKLAVVLGITKGAVSQVTRKLLEKNLIKKNSSGDKVNETPFSLTDDGKVVYSYHQAMHKEMFDKIDLILSDLPEENKVAMNRIIQVIEDSLDEL